MGKTNIKTETSQRSRSFRDPLDLGTFSATSIRYLTGRLGAENKGQAIFRCDNTGANKGFQNVWFKFKLTAPGYVILVKDTKTAGKYISRWVDLHVYDNTVERRSMAHPILYDGMNSYYRGMIAGTQSDLYNVIDEASSYEDQNRTTLLPLAKGTYTLCINTQRWDQFRYGVYLILEMPYRSGYVQLEDAPGDDKRYLTQDQSTVSVPAFFLFEDANPNVLTDVRASTIHDAREWKRAWEQLYPNKTFPAELQNYLELANADNI